VDPTGWDERYASADLVWSATPNVWVEQVTTDLPPARALDLAGGEGRNALWLIDRGWQATLVDFSQVALDRAHRLADERFGTDDRRLRTLRADLLTFEPDPSAYDLVLIAYLHLVAEDRRSVMRMAARAFAPGGALMVVGHDSTNLTSGTGGPQDPAVLYGPADLVDDLQGCGLTIERAEIVTRAVQAPEGPRDAMDVVLVAHQVDVSASPHQGGGSP
jgi:SAM-dependent methyltransferase